MIKQRFSIIPPTLGLCHHRVQQAAAGIWLTSLMLVSGLLLSACSTMPQSIAGHYSAITPAQINADEYNGVRVRWGGRIIETVPEKDRTCIYVLAHRLDRSGRPIINDANEGRFAACHEGYLEPAKYAPDRDITVTGVINGTMTRDVGNYAYGYPQLDIDTAYLWAERVPVQPMHPGAFDPFWGPWYMNPYGRYPYRPYFW